MAIRDRIAGRRDPERDGVDERHDRGVDERHDRERREEPVERERAPRRAATMRERQREEFGGINWGAAFFGWLVAVGMGALLTALLSAAGTAVAISEFESPGQAAQQAVEEGDTIGIIGGILLLAIGLVAYFAGGYVAGRMSRFDGARQGIAVWIWAAVVAIVLAVLAAIAGDEYNVLGALDLPRIPVSDEDVTTGGIIVLLAVLAGTLLAAMAGGKAGEAYHRRVDAAGADARPARRGAGRREERVREERA